MKHFDFSDNYSIQKWLDVTIKRFPQNFSGSTT